MASKQVETRLQHRSFRLTRELGHRRLKPHLLMAEWSLDLFGLAFVIPTAIAAYLCAGYFGYMSLTHFIAIIPATGVWFLSRWLCSRLHVWFGVITASEARDYWQHKSSYAKGYPESWLERLDDDVSLAADKSAKNKVR